MNYKEEKQRAEKLVATLKQLQKKAKKKTKNSRIMIKAAEDFIKCNITNEAIVKKYQNFNTTIERFINDNKR